MLVFTRELTPRLKYIFEFIIEEIFNLELQITSDSAQFNESKLPKINYSDQFFNDSFRIKPAKLLFENDIREQDLYVPVWKDMNIMFLTDPESDLPFDPFAASFFMLSRYEEYLIKERDIHGRFDVFDSLAYNNDFLNFPIVDYWIMELEKNLVAKSPELKIRQKKYAFTPTIDVDEPFAFKQKGLLRTIGGILNSNSRKIKGENKIRLKVLFGKMRDPYDTFEMLEEWFKQFNLSPIFFFQVGKYGKFDKNPPAGKGAYRKLISRISENYEIGLHPSYRSNFEPAELKSEITVLQEVTNKPVSRSRQHYLKLKIPDTYRNLIRLGITEDYTMGFAGDTGFRAGTSNPFFFYDLLKEEKTELKIFPFHVMDGTLKEYLRMDQEEAKERIRNLIDRTRQVNGTFTSLWHNSSLNDWGAWQGWLEVYEEMLRLAK